MTEHELAEIIKDEWGCRDVRVLPDGTIIGTGTLIYTTALYIGMSRDGWERRYCYKDMAALHENLNSLQSGDDEPWGWVARRE